MQKDIEDARVRLADIEDLQEKLDELTMKDVGLDSEVGKLKVKVVEPNKVSIAKFKLMLNTVVAQFLANERLKIKRPMKALPD